MRCVLDLALASTSALALDSVDIATASFTADRKDAENGLVVLGRVLLWIEKLVLLSRQHDDMIARVEENFILYVGRAYTDYVTLGSYG